MSGIYIPNMEMPKIGDAIHLTIFGNGEVFEEDYFGNVKRITNAKEVPTHGRLGDLDKLFNDLKRMCVLDSLAYTTAHEILQGLVKNAQTVIEASTKQGR